eukprot:5637274-Prymnesium_polylepis.1
MNVTRGAAWRNWCLALSSRPLSRKLWARSRPTVAKASHNDRPNRRSRGSGHGKLVAHASAALCVGCF